MSLSALQAPISQIDKRAITVKSQRGGSVSFEDCPSVVAPLRSPTRLRHINRYDQGRTLARCTLNRQLTLAETGFRCWRYETDLPTGADDVRC